MEETGSRLYIHEAVYDRFLAALKTSVEQTTIGPANDPTCNFGPIVNRVQYERVCRFLAAAKKEGLSCLTGGAALEDKQVYLDVPEESSLAREEIFGPVLVVLKPFKTLEDVLHRANDTTYALAAGIFSDSQHVIDTLVSRLKVGTTWVNYYNACLPWMPFGGYKRSGFGRDLGDAAILSEFTEVRTVNVQLF